jgi:hypothetical protein
MSAHPGVPFVLSSQDKFLLSGFGTAHAGIPTIAKRCKKHAPDTPLAFVCQLGKVYLYPYRFTADSCFVAAEYCNEATFCIFNLTTR